MDRDPSLYGRAARLLDLAARRFRLGRTTTQEHTARRERISTAHYRTQHATGASDYPKAI